VLTTIRYFRSEYEAHIREKRCPAKACRALIQYRVIAAKCPGCGVCLKVCPAEAITGAKKEVHVIHEDVCTRCGLCMEKCKLSAIEIVSPRGA
jgi:ferredoxin